MIRYKLTRAAMVYMDLKDYWSLQSTVWDLLLMREIQEVRLLEDPSEPGMVFYCSKPVEHLDESYSWCLMWKLLVEQYMTQLEDDDDHSETTPG